jgi:flagellar hook-associated protein 2
MDNDIQRLEMRLAKREEALNKQFSALENLMSLMNSQSNFLSQQTELMKNLWSRN